MLGKMESKQTMWKQVQANIQKRQTDFALRLKIELTLNKIDLKAFIEPIRPETQTDTSWIQTDMKLYCLDEDHNTKWPKPNPNWPEILLTWCGPKFDSDPNWIKLESI